MQVGTHVFKVTLADGLQVALKQFPEAPPPDPLRTESTALRRLHSLGCPVPEVYLAETSVRVLATAWAGDRMAAAIAAVQKKDRCFIIFSANCAHPRRV